MLVLTYYTCFLFQDVHNHEIKKYRGETIESPQQLRFKDGGGDLLVELTDCQTGWQPRLKTKVDSSYRGMIYVLQVYYVKANVCALKESECNVFYVESSSYCRRNGTSDPILKVAGFFFYSTRWLIYHMYVINHGLHSLAKLKMQMNGILRRESDYRRQFSFYFFFFF